MPLASAGDASLIGDALARPAATVRQSAWRTSPAVLLGLMLVAAAVFAIRLTGLPNLLDNEYRIGAQVMDVLQHGHWLCPRDLDGNTYKPPMLTWLAAVASWPAGRVTPLGLYLPTALATLLLAWLIAIVGDRELGGRAGTLGAVAYLCSHTGAEQMAMARWDGLFAATVAVTAVAAHRAWTRQTSWTWFWLAAALATLTKGPLGVILASFGLLAVPWERASGRPRPLVGSHRTGVVLYLLIVFGWFGLAYREVGTHLIDDMIRGELFGHAVEHAIGYRFTKPLGDVMTDFAPWSVVAVLAALRVLFAPDPSDRVRRFERFCFCWGFGGLLFFCLSPHNQARLLLPMMPAFAWLAGHELDRLTRTLPARALGAGAAAVVVLGLGVFWTEYHRRDTDRRLVRVSQEIERVAEGVRETVGEEFPLTYASDATFALQMALDTMRPTVTYVHAAELLAGDAAAFVVVGDIARLRGMLPPAVPLYELDSTPVIPPEPTVYLVGNRPRLGWDAPVAAGVGTLDVTLTGVRLGIMGGDALQLWARARPRVAVIANLDPTERALTVRIGEGPTVSRVLAPHESWRVELP